MKEIKIGNEDFGLPFTPSEFVGEPSYREVTDLLMSYGGGLGGNNMHIYVPVMTDIPTNQIIWEKDINGDEVFINTAYIVLARQYTLAEVRVRNKGNTSSGKRIGDIIEYRMLLKSGEKVKLISEYNSESSSFRK